MPQTKLIYGVGRIPKASEFSLGEVIVNVDDSKVYSKSKSNVVFEIGTNSSSTTSAIAFSTASAFGSGIITAQEGSNTLIISGGSGITVATGSNNDLIISSQGDPDSDWFIDTVNGRLTASLDVYTKGDITGSNLVVTGSGGINFDPNGDSANFESVAIRYRFGEDGDFNSKRIIFSKTPTGTYQSRFQQNNKQYLLLKETFTGIKTLEINEGNSAINQVDFIVYDKNDDYNIFATASGKVGIGTSTPEEKLTVAGNISASGDLILRNITSSGEHIALKSGSTSDEEFKITFHDDETKIVFEKDSTAGFPLSQESINFFAEGAHLMSVGSRGGSTDRVIINPNNDSGDNVFFNVRGGAFGDDDLIITSPTFNAVGMGVTPNASATSTYGAKLQVKGNISASGFLRLAATGSGTALAGALMYSSSNEFYLGFS